MLNSTKNRLAGASASDGGHKRRRTSKLKNGGVIFSREESLTIKVGPLPAHWEKKLDPVILKLERRGSGRQDDEGKVGQA